MLILASQSPRRAEILRAAGIDFEVRPAGVPEVRLPHEGAAAYVRRLAREKAGAVQCGAADIVLAADTVVVVDGEVLEKPADAGDAARMLRLLSGREHQVVTGYCIDGVVGVEVTTVRFVELADDEIADYIASGEPMDKAGAYAIQGLASKFIDRIEGDYFNVVGLPVAAVYRRLKAIRGRV